jgi:transglutaminase-like putative cysteine protease
LVFAALPRLPGYQFRTFPVSSTIELNSEFDSQRIINPGYVQGGRGGETEGTGEADGQGSQGGQVDSTQYYGFNTRINQNLRGELKPQVVLRVRSQAKGFWRVLAFDHYLGQGWEISQTQPMRLNRPPWSYSFQLPIPRGGILTQPTKEVVQTYTSVTPLPNLMPALAQPQVLYFPTRQVAIDTEGSLRSPVPLETGLTYTVISKVPYRDRTQLRSAPTTYSPGITDSYLQLPESIRERLRQTAEAILQKSEKPIESPYEQALFLAQYLKQHYTIQPDLPQFAPDEDLAAAFLFKYEGGYPDHFSTTLTVLLRAIGIPARLVVGYGPGEFNPFTGFYVVKNTDAYAMAEVYFPGYGWFPFDPIPGHDLIPPSIEEDTTFSALKSFWAWVAGWFPTPVRNFFSGVISAVLGFVAGAIAWVVSRFVAGWQGLLQLLLAAIGLGLLGWLAWNGWKGWRYHRWLTNLPPMEALYQQMLQGLAQQGIRKHPAQTPFEYAQVAQTSQQLTDTPQHQAIQAISQAYVSWRYGRQQPNLGELRQWLDILKPAFNRKRSKAM